MKGRIIKLTLLFCVLVLLLSFGLFLYAGSASQGNDNAETIVALNEIEQLAKEHEIKKMNEKISFLQENLRSKEYVSNNTTLPLLFGAIGVLFVFSVFTYVYIAILQPFEKMKKYANQIAAGDFNLPLDYERSNYFGEFTWAFDSMRREITKARACEREAIENNKTVIATLSHDIKTPIASIRAYSEGLEANLDATPEKRSRYLSVIMKKCDEVSALTNDLFIHSLSDLEKLKIYPQETELCSFTRDILVELSGNKDDISVQTTDLAVTLNLDQTRYTQLVENIINNARKYAKTKIEVWFSLSESCAEVHFKDHGRGIPDEDMPFIFDKFYRGKNCGTEQGSGLGLYIVKYTANQMHGDARLQNHSDGLEVILSFLRTS